MRATGPALDSLQGLALDDAFGDRWFSVPPDEAPAAVTARLPRPAPWHWTDDTTMALALVRHLIRNGEVVPDTLAPEFAEGYVSDHGREYGPSMHGVLREIDRGADWRAVTARQFGGQGSHGNGAAMRAAPLGAWFAEDLGTVARHAELQALTTHFHPEAATGAVVVALAAALATRSRGRQPPSRVELPTEVAGRLPDSDVRSGLRIAARLPEHTSVRHAATVLGSGLQISAPDTVPFALWSAAGQSDSLPEAIWHTLEGWGDMDTTCAIAAGVVAARTGVADAPAAWLAAREELPAWVAEVCPGQAVAGTGRDRARGHRIRPAGALAPHPTHHIRPVASEPGRGQRTERPPHRRTRPRPPHPARGRRQRRELPKRIRYRISSTSAPPIADAQVARSKKCAATGRCRKCEEIQPPTKDPAMPIRVVTTRPPGSLPGSSNLARAPATRPSTIQATIPMRPPTLHGTTTAVPSGPLLLRRTHRCAPAVPVRRAWHPPPWAARAAILRPGAS